MSEQKPNLLFVVNEIPVDSTGGGALLCEMIRFFQSRFTLTVAVPVYDHLQEAFEASCVALPATVKWICLSPRRGRGSLRYRFRRIISPLPGDAFAFSTRGNAQLLEQYRSHNSDHSELYLSTWALATCPAGRLPAGAMLYMVNVDTEILKPKGSSLCARIDCWLERFKTSRLMKRGIQSASRVGAITYKDAQTLESIGRISVETVPPIMAPKQCDRSDTERGCILLTTNFRYIHNRDALEWFLEKVWPSVSHSGQLLITGLDTSDSALASLVRGRSRVKYLGCLEQADFDACYQRASFVVNPTLSGSGFQIKLLDALRRGVPVVSTDFSNPLGSLIPSADDPDELASVINRQLSSASDSNFDYSSYYSNAVCNWTSFLNTGLGVGI